MSTKNQVISLVDCFYGAYQKLSAILSRLSFQEGIRLRLSLLGDHHYLKTVSTWEVITSLAYLINILLF
jgi:hypothetical protein